MSTPLSPVILYPRFIYAAFLTSLSAVHDFWCGHNKVISASRFQESYSSGYLPMVMDVESLDNLGVSQPCPSEPLPPPQQPMQTEQHVAGSPLDGQQQPMQAEEQPVVGSPLEHPKRYLRRPDACWDPFARCPICSWSPEGQILP